MVGARPRGALGLCKYFSYFNIGVDDDYNNNIGFEILLPMYGVQKEFAVQRGENCGG